MMDVIYKCIQANGTFFSRGIRTKMLGTGFDMMQQGEVVRGGSDF